MIDDDAAYWEQALARGLGTQWTMKGLDSSVRSHSCFALSRAFFLSPSRSCFTVLPLMAFQGRQYPTSPIRRAEPHGLPISDHTPHEPGDRLCPVSDSEEDDDEDDGSEEHEGSVPAVAAAVGGSPGVPSTSDTNSNIHMNRPP